MSNPPAPNPRGIFIDEDAFAKCIQLCAENTAATRSSHEQHHLALDCMGAGGLGGTCAGTGGLGLFSTFICKKKKMQDNIT